jgi:hypothetical protein
MISHGCQDVCGGCRQRFKQLFTHMALSALCAEHYKNVPVLRTSSRFSNTTTELEEPSQSSAFNLQTCHGIHDESPSEIEETACNLPEGFSSQLNAAFVSDPVQENNATSHNIDIASPVFDGFVDNDAYK